MTALTGRTHVKHITVKLDNSGGTLTNITAHCDNVGSIGLEFDTQDVTGYSDGVRNIVIGQPRAPLAIGGPFDTTLHAMMILINGALTPLSLDIQIGIRAAWEAGAPQFGISQSDSSGYLVHDYKVDPNANRWTARLDVFGATAPAWGTTAET
jgi:hypothetical protein